MELCIIAFSNISNKQKMQFFLKCLFKIAIKQIKYQRIYIIKHLQNLNKGNELPFLPDQKSRVKARPTLEECSGKAPA